MPKRKLFEHEKLSLYNDGTFLINSESQKLEKEYLFKLFNILEPILEDWHDHSIKSLLEEINEKNDKIIDLEIAIEDLEDDITELKYQIEDLEDENEHLSNKLNDIDMLD